MNQDANKNLTIREKVVIRLILFLIQVVKPYEYEYQFKEWFTEMKEQLNEESQNV